MPKTNRRAFIGALAASGATLTGTQLAAAPGKLGFSEMKKDADIACVYHCDFGDPKRFSLMLSNINNHLSVYEFDPFKIKIVTVALGDGIKFFLHDLSGTPWAGEKIDSDFYKRFTGLSKYGVEAYLCEITFAQYRIDKAKVGNDSFLKFVPSGVATLGALQGVGYAYLKVG
jgi:intracellular sulfur oxidation DsrE/DsrF family protein